MRSQLGDGAMGRVFEAWDPLLLRSVAVKAVKSELLTPQTAGEYLRRFGLEARAAGSLSHPSIVKVFDVGPDYLVMERLTGVTLRELLDRQGCLPPAEVVRLLIPVADALDYAHRVGVVHRDVKPANVLVQPDGSPMLMDFGVAHIASSVVTNRGEVFGSPAYMAPEQILGEEADGSGDVYALAVVAYEMLTGRPPFSGTVTQVIYKVVHEPAPLPGQVNAALPLRFDQVFARALQKRPEQRYPTASDFVSALASADETLRPLSRFVPRSGLEHGRVEEPTPGDSVACRTPRSRRPRAGWYAHLETLAWPGATPRQRRHDPTTTLLGLALLVALAAGSSALLVRSPDNDAPSRSPVPSPPLAAARPAPTVWTPEDVPRPAGEPVRADTPLVQPDAPGVRRVSLARATRVETFAVPIVSSALTTEAPRSSDDFAGPQGDEILALQPGVTPPRQLSGETVLPRSEGRDRLNGTVGIRMLIDENGVPLDLVVVESAGEALDQAALASVRSWRFQPALKDGVPVRVRWMARQTYHLTP